MEQSADQAITVGTRHNGQCLAVSSHGPMVTAGNRRGFSLLLYTILPIIILCTLIFEHYLGLKNGMCQYSELIKPLISFIPALRLDKPVFFYDS